MHQVKERSHLPPESPIMPRLREMQDNGKAWKAVSAADKAELLRVQFFSEEANADLSNIESYQYLQSVKQLLQITPEIVNTVISQRLVFSAPEINNIPNIFLKIIKRSFEQAAAALIQAC